VQDILQDEGLEGLRRLPGIGQSLAHAIEQMIHTGRVALLERLRGENAPERIFTSLPNIGPELARRIHEHLNIESLVELQAAAWDGRLQQVPGMGRKRLQAIRESLAARFQPERPATAAREPRHHEDEPDVSELLDIDQQYRKRAAAGSLPTIAPKRFNPGNQAWLPILHTHRGERHYTALFSNTARAHQLGTTRDWVVIYRDDETDHGQWTVITSQFGKLKGKRLVRGREEECEEYYREPTHR
jgi:hypothetical protein